MPNRLHKIERKPAASVQYGSSALRGLMDELTPGIDLLVRESIQNSLDAAASPEIPVNIDFDFGPSRLKPLCDCLDTVSATRLSNTVSGKHSGVSLTISDRNTIGLDGPTDYTDGPDHDPIKPGNFLKLTSSIGLRNQNSGAGGSWGIGKTVFYRVSATPVVYYSRFRDATEYRERLIVSLIEDHDNTPEPISPKSTGFSWWGRPSQAENPQPVEESAVIAEVAHHLGLPRFSGSDTGTVVLIPEIRIGQFPALDHSDTTSFPAPWVPRESSPSAFADYVRIAVQRWYAPALARDDVGAPVIRVNAKPITRDDLLPLFGIFAALFRKARYSEDAPELSEIRTETVQLNSTFTTGTKAGSLSIVSLSPESPVLQMAPPDNGPDPQTQITNFAASVPENRGVIVANIRSPGMIVEYHLEDEWVSRSSVQNVKGFLFALFVLQGSALLTDQYPQTSLEEYIRLHEPPAHNRWEDGKSKGGAALNLVTRLVRNVQKKIEKHATTDEPRFERKHSRLARMLAADLLPNGFGRQSTLPYATHFEKQKKTPKSNAVGVLEIDPRDVRYHEDTIEVPFVLTDGKLLAVDLELQVEASSSRMNARRWHKDIGTPFPCRYYAAKDLEYQHPVHGNTSLADIQPNETSTEDEHVSINLVPRHGANDTLALRFSKQRVDVAGTLVLKAARRTIAFRIQVVSANQEGES